MTAQQATASLEVAAAMAECIRTSPDGLPSGTLYAMVMGRLSLQSYEAIIRALVGAGLVRQDASFFLTWNGPTFPETKGQAS